MSLSLSSSFLIFLGESMVGIETRDATDLPRRGRILMIFFSRESSMGFVCGSNMSKEVKLGYNHNT